VNNLAPMRCAIYARYSTDMQRSASIEDQARRCREYAARQQGHIIVEDYVRYDKATTGATLNNRQGLMSLIEAAEAGSNHCRIASSADSINALNCRRLSS